MLLPHRLPCVKGDVCERCQRQKKRAIRRSRSTMIGKTLAVRRQNRCCNRKVPRSDGEIVCRTASLCTMSSALCRGGVSPPANSKHSAAYRAHSIKAQHACPLHSVLCPPVPPSASPCRASLRQSSSHTPSPLHRRGRCPHRPASQQCKAHSIKVQHACPLHSVPCPS